MPYVILQVALGNHLNVCKAPLEPRGMVGSG